MKGYKFKGWVHKNIIRHPKMFFLLIPIFMLVRGHTSEAVPIVLRQEQPTPNSNGGETETRTMLNIIWGCFSTMFICTWVSVHPNVPPQPREACGWKSLLRRLRLVFWALIAPELVLAWSAKQWFVAGSIADMYNDKKGGIKNPLIMQPALTPTHLEGMKTEGTWNMISSAMKDFLRGKEGSKTNGIHFVYPYLEAH